MGRSGVPKEYKQALHQAASHIGVTDVHIFESGGALNPVYQKAYQDLIKRESGNESLVSDQNSDRSGKESDADEEEEEEEEKEDEEKERKGTRKDTVNKNSDTTDPPDECTAWLCKILNKDKRVIRRKNVNHDSSDALKGLRLKGSLFKSNFSDPSRSPHKRLSPRAKLGSLKKARDFITLNDKRIRGQKDLILSPENPFQGGAVTRSKSQQNSNLIAPNLEQIDGKKGSQSVIQASAKERVNDTDPESREKIDNNLEAQVEDRDSEKDTIGKGELPSEKEFTLKRNGIVIMDDIFVSEDLADENGGNDNKANAEAMVKTIRHIAHFAELGAHHFSLSLFLVSQSAQIFTGSSILANYIRRIKNNFDIFVLFRSNSNSIRHFIQSMAAGSDYQNLKELYNYAVDTPACSSLDPSDQRTCFPYLAFSQNKQHCHPDLLFR